MNTQDGSARSGRVQMVVARDGRSAMEVLRVARHVECAVVAIAVVAVVLWLIAHLVQVAFAVGLIACTAKAACRLARF